MSIYVRDAGGNRQKIAGVGLPGPAGKSAYQYAVEGGFSGTEEEFRAVVGVRSNDNLLDNWYLVDPINQRGQTEYIGFVYTIDRWITEGATIKVGDDGLQLENPSEGAVQFVTNFEASRLIDNQVYTASLLAKDLIGSGTMVIQYREGAFTYLLFAPLSDGLISVSGNLSTSGVNLLGYMIVLHPNSSVKLIAAKLELGPVQTLAHKDAFGNWVLNDPPPNKALELAKCQRYQLPLLDRSGNYGCPIGFGVFQNALGRIIIPTPTTMRGTPTLTVLNGNISAFEIIDVSGTPHPVATITTQGKFSNGIYLGVTITDTIATSPSIGALKYTSTGIPMLDSNL